MPRLAYCAYPTLLLVDCDLGLSVGFANPSITWLLRNVQNPPLQVDSQPDGGTRITHVATSKLKGRLPPGLGESSDS